MFNVWKKETSRLATFIQQTTQCGAKKPNSELFTLTENHDTINIVLLINQ